MRAYSWLLFAKPKHLVEHQEGEVVKLRRSKPFRNVPGDLKRLKAAQAKKLLRILGDKKADARDRQWAERVLIETGSMPFTIDRDESGTWVAECCSIPGCVSQGLTKASAIKNIREAIEGCLEVRALSEVRRRKGRINPVSEGLCHKATARSLP